MQRERHACVLVLSPLPLPGLSSRSPGPQVMCWHVYRLSAVRGSGISRIIWAAAAVGSTSDGGIFYIQLPLSSG